MAKLTTTPAGLTFASIRVHAAKEDESKKQLVKPEQVIYLQMFVNILIIKHGKMSLYYVVVRSVHQECLGNIC